MKTTQPLPATETRAALPALTERLRRRSRKVTGQRLAVLDVLRRHAQPLTIKEVFARLDGRNCDLATIYRSIHLLEEMGMVRRFNFGDGGDRFELVPENDQRHHHHLVCIECSAVVRIHECFPAELEERVARANRFKAVTHRLDFFGVCPRCQ
jgi:Fur family ferric uptake transcriptional regulator